MLGAKDTKENTAVTTSNIYGRSSLLLGKNRPETQWFKQQALIISISVGKKFWSASAGWFWFRASQEASVGTSAGTAVT